MNDAAALAWVFVGGGLGSLLRWWVGLFTDERWHHSFPLATFIINVTGAFVIGFLSVLFKIDWRDRYGTPLNALVLTGFLGGYTTFSSMQLDTAKLWNGGQRWLAWVYQGSSVVVGLAAAFLGGWLAGVFG